MLLFYQLPRYRRDGFPYPGIKQFKIIVNLSRSPNGRARIAGIYLLLNGNGRWNPFNKINLGFMHPPQELAGIRRQAFYIAALPFGIKGIESQRRLSASREARSKHQLIEWNVE